jgi:ABC-2 type transport system permease protein
LSKPKTTKTTSGAFQEMVKFESRLALRDPIGLIFGLVGPLVLLLIFGNVPMFKVIVPGTTRTLFDLYLPSLIAMGVVFIALLSLPLPLVRDRELGWLRRLSTSPVSPTRLLAAQVVINVLLVCASVAIVLVGGWSLFGVKMPSQPLGFTLSAILMTAALFGIALFVSSLASTQSIAVGFSQILLYPLLFFAGVYYPLSSLPNVIGEISRFTPVGAAVSAMTTTLTGAFPATQDLLVLAAYAIIFSVVAVRYFRWK